MNDKTDYKVLYFKVHEHGKLEVGLIPTDEKDIHLKEDNFRDRKNTILTVPPSVKVMTFKAGDPWPFLVPKLSYYSWDSVTKFGTVDQIRTAICEHPTQEG
jgi:hypothetical protein